MSNLDNINEIKIILETFRVADLKSVLFMASQSRSGRKIDLENRILDLIRYANHETKSMLLDKIKELQTSLMQRRRVQYSPFGNTIINQDASDKMADLIFPKNPFYEYIDELIKPTNLVPSYQGCVSHLYFALNVDQTNDIALERIWKNANDYAYPIQIQMRFFKFEQNENVQNDSFPPGLCVLINGIQVLGINMKDPKPLNITSYVKLSPGIKNRIMIKYIPGPIYTATIYRVKKLECIDLVDKLQTKIRPKIETITLINDKLKDVDEISTTSLTISNICPLSKMKIKEPIIGKNCRHLNCFDALNYIQMNEINPKWNCPICFKNAIYDDLIIDEYFKEICNQIDDKKENIQLHLDGTWSC